MPRPADCSGDEEETVLQTPLPPGHGLQQHLPVKVTENHRLGSVAPNPDYSRIEGQNPNTKIVLKVLEVKPSLPPTHRGNSVELETSHLSHEEHNVSEENMLGDGTSVEEEEQHKVNIATEEEDKDPAEVHDANEGHVSEDTSSVEEEEQENIANEEEEEDPAEYSPGGFHPVSVGDTWRNRCCR